MDNETLGRAFQPLSTALIADACRQLGDYARVGPAQIRPMEPGWKVAGRARPVRHDGSVDILFAAVSAAEPGDVLVVDNAGRLDESCVGDLIALEAAAAGIAGLVIWGCHRDTLGLIAIDLPTFSLGPYPAGPRRAVTAPAEVARSVQVGTVTVSGDDVVLADVDGVIFLPAAVCWRVLPLAADLHRRERGQAAAVADGWPLRAQLRYQAYADLQARNPSYTFREHLHRVGGAIES